jgi:hypothetical protein
VARKDGVQVAGHASNNGGLVANGRFLYEADHERRLAGEVVTFGGR